LGSVFTTITLVVILFEGGTTLSIATLKSAWKSTMTLSLAGFFASVSIVATIVYFALDFSIISSITMGGVLGGTSSAVVIPFVKQLKLGEDSKTSLILESALTDVLCIVLALACVQVFLQGELNLGTMFGSVISSFSLAALMGILGAMLWSRAISFIRRIQYSIFTTPAFVFVIYGIAELLGFNGAIAALAFGIAMANIDTFKGFIFKKIMGGEGHKLNDIELIFLQEFTFLLKTFFFIYIGLSILFSNIQATAMGAIITVVLYAVRLFVAKYASPVNASLFDKSVISMMTPKGLAAAVLANIPELAGFPEGTMIKNITYSVVLFTILFTSILIIINNKSDKLQAFYSVFFGKNRKLVGQDSNSTPTTNGIE
ncbi:MAG: cation:proton antiporter, partial [Bacteroidales bacterium]